jgi:shikimate 5-dehydrogenase
VERAESLAKELAPYMRTSQLLGPKDRLAVLSTDPVALEEELQDIDLIVNATSIGMARTDPSPLPQRALMPFHMVYDTVYAHGDTRLVLAARAVGARAANGLSMLLHQGVLSLEIWLQKSPPVSVMRAALGA